MISILLATYNGEKYIKKSIDSVLNQTFKDFELLIGFNGTTDNSREIVENYNDNRIKVFDFGTDKGKSKTLNKLLKHTSFDWLAVQDDDDVWDVTKLEKQIKHIIDFDVIGTQISYIDIYDKHIGSPNLQTNDLQIKQLSLKGNNQVANTSVIFKKKDALEVGGWREDIDGIEDFDFWLKLMRLNKRFINLGESLVNHRLHSQSNFNTKRYNLTKIL
jgi:glycosyltransferase involved in cell wall biosynthesis